LNIPSGCKHRGRAMLATPEKSTGRVLFDGACSGGAQAAGRLSGVIEPGMYADLLALNASHVDLAGRSGDMLLDSFIFAGDSSMVSDVWAAGRHMVRDGRHVAREAITSAYAKATAQLMDII
jgi:formimidoylglutamate deiminase